MLFRNILYCTVVFDLKMLVFMLGVCCSRMGREGWWGGVVCVLCVSVAGKDANRLFGPSCFHGIHNKRTFLAERHWGGWEGVVGIFCVCFFPLGRSYPPAHICIV